MGALLQFAFDFSHITCANCGIGFAMPQHFATKRREDHKTFYCPSGHENWFPGETEAERLQKALEREQKLHEWTRSARDRADERADHNERRARAYKGKLTHIKTRVANGVCPCCRRSFTNLARHMTTQHPTFKGDDRA